MYLIYIFPFLRVIFIFIHVNQFYLFNPVDLDNFSFLYLINLSMINFNQIIILHHFIYALSLLQEILFYLSVFMCFKFTIYFILFMFNILIFKYLFKQLNLINLYFFINIHQFIFQILLFIVDTIKVFFHILNIIPHWLCLNFISVTLQFIMFDSIVDFIAHLYTICPCLYFININQLLFTYFLLFNHFLHLF